MLNPPGLFLFRPLPVAFNPCSAASFIYNLSSAFARSRAPACKPGGWCLL
jgi:hypothetical protein